MAAHPDNTSNFHDADNAKNAKSAANVQFLVQPAS